MRIALVGKYNQLADAYLSVIEALNHAGTHHGGKVEVHWVDSERLTDGEVEAELATCDGILVPGGFGVRGIEGKIRAARFARENGVPYLGICLGMQIAVSEFARHVAGMDGANSTEFDPETPFPVIDLLPEQKEVRDMGGTMRLGADPVKLHEGTRAREIYGEAVIYERHRHRYEVNNHLRKRLEHAGLMFSGTSPDDRLVEVIELPDHPFFVASQYHPEFKSPPAAPAAAVPRLRGSGDGARPRARARGRARGAGRDARVACLGSLRRVTVRSLQSASSAERERLLDDFVRLCEIESPSRSERAVADAVKAELERLGLQVEEDDTAAETGSDAGNLLARIEGPPDARTILLCAHLDTVPLAGPVEVRQENGVLTNRHEAILGADNKAAVATILAAARRLTPGRPARRHRAAVHHLRGARARGRQGVRPGPPELRVRLRLRPRLADRRARHRLADLLPPRGRASAARPPTPASAPRRATTRSSPPRKAIAAMQIGRLDDQTTANVGQIEGGTAANVVAERCNVVLEARSLDDARAGEVVSSMVDAVTEAASDLECDVETSVERLFRGYKLARTAPVVEVAAEALRQDRHRAGLHKHRRRQRRQRADRRRPARAERRQRHRAQPPARRVGHRRRARDDARRDARDRRGQRPHLDDVERDRQRHGLGGAASRPSASTASATTTARRPTARSSRTPASVAVVAHDGEQLFLVRQPREAVGEPEPARAARREARRGGRGAARDRQARARRGDRQGRAQLAAT